MKRVAIVGTVGLPANYGGFETLAENIIGENVSGEVEYTVFCSALSYKEKPKTYKGAKLRYIYMKANGIQSIIYDIVSLIKCWGHYDIILILGTSGCLFLPLFRLFFNRRIIVNIDGMEYRRPKWGPIAKWFLKKSERMAVRYADIIIADNLVIQKYIKEIYGKDAELITYGGDHAIRCIGENKQDDILKKYKVKRGEYAIAVCRIEPENNCHIILEAFSMAGMKLLFIGNWEKGSYGRMLKERFSKCDNIDMLEPEYDIDILYTLRKNSEVYIHGHSAGGTNPSLVEAMSIGCNILAYDVSYNKVTTHDLASYFANEQELCDMILKHDIHNGLKMYNIADKEYTWKKIAKQYEQLFVSHQQTIILQ